MNRFMFLAGRGCGIILIAGIVLTCGIFGYITLRIAQPAFEQGIAQLAAGAAQPTAPPTQPATPQATQPATVVPPVTPPPSGGGVCRLDKIGTWSEVGSAGPQRIELGGNGVQHVDYYPERDVKSVSFILPSMPTEESPVIVHGFGSTWEAPVDGSCSSYDFEADAQAYAEGRLDSGHSGKVVDLRGMSWAQVHQYFETLDFSEVLADSAAQPPVPPVVATSSPVQPNQGGTTAVCSAVRQGDSDNMAAVTAAMGTTLVVETWGSALGESFLIVPEGESVQRVWQGGAIWLYNCTDLDAIRAEHANRGRLVKVVIDGQIQ